MVPLPLRSFDDRKQERALAALITSARDEAEALITVALLRPRGHIVRALTAELIQRRTMTAPEIDAIIAAAVAAKAAEDERQRRSAWARICVNASTFTPDGCVPETFWLLDLFLNKAGCWPLSIPR